MKKLLLFSALLIISFCVQLSAQTTVTTWYIIPPTNGCNGVWAIDYVPTTCGLSYSYNPVGCAPWTGGSVVADTLFVPLCSIPCDMYVVDTSGNFCAICGTGTSAGTEENSAQRIITTYPNPASTTAGWNVMLKQPGKQVTVSFYNSLGQLVSAQSSENADQIFYVDISILEAGNYIAEIAVNGAAPYRQQLILTN